MVSRRTYIQSIGSLGIGSLGGVALTEDKRCNVDLSFQQDDDPEPIPPSDLPDKFGKDVEDLQGSLPSQIRGLNTRLRMDGIGNALAPETVLVDIYDCDDGREHTYRADISMETLEDGKFASINKYLEEGEERTVRKELGRTYGAILPQTMEMLSEYIPTRDTSGPSTLTHMDVTVNARRGGKMTAALNAEGMDEAYRAAERSNTNVRREASQRVAMDYLTLKKTPPTDPYGSG